MPIQAAHTSSIGKLYKEVITPLECKTVLLGGRGLDAILTGFPGRPAMIGWGPLDWLAAGGILGRPVEAEAHTDETLFVWKHEHWGALYAAQTKFDRNQKAQMLYNMFAYLGRS